MNNSSYAFACLNIGAGPLTAKMEHLLRSSLESSSSQYLAAPDGFK